MTESSKMQVLGIVGSPRRAGNTELLVDQVLDGAKEAGALTDKVILNEMNIHPCQACNDCYKTGQCKQEDDMINLLDKMIHSKIWVLGTPIYWWGPTAQFKIFLDRWYSPKHREFKGKRVILVIPLGGDHEKYARHTVGILKDVLDYLGIELFETIIALGVNRRGAIGRKSDLMEKAREIGKAALEF
ncbi:MAG: flavodoxin family protein [Promethearchaeota archaeon]|nr:MAG: flavodoxin family protein [Candidatus Lokiarchaeota archaeon]